VFKGVRAGGVTLAPSPPQHRILNIPADPLICYIFKDDVTVIHLLGASFMVARAYKYFVLGLFAVDVWLY
jgi:hypothetical protein